MAIDLFEIVAQMVNFFILILLLKRFFYKPILAAMERREQRINAAQSEAMEKVEEANELIKSYVTKMAEFNNKEEEMLEQAKASALEKKTELIDEYKKEANYKKFLFLEEIETEKETFLRNLRKSLGENSVRIASRVLSTISDEDLREKVFDTFIDKIESLESHNIEDEQFIASSENLILISSKKMPEDKKRIVESKLKKLFQDEFTISYEVDPSLILGYELKLETLTISSNIEKYLNESEKRILSVIDEYRSPEARNEVGRSARKQG